MSKILVPIKMPDECMTCPFLSDSIEMPAGNTIGVYKKVARCMFAPKDIKDPWKNIIDLLDGRESYCPLEEVKEE